ITTSQVRSYDAMAKVVTREKPDFFQVNYSLGALEAEKTLLPAARGAGAAAWSGAKTWPQSFLKCTLGHPAVTAVIPGTDKPEYMLDNLDAGRGALPDAAMRKRIVQYWDSLA